MAVLSLTSRGEASSVRRHVVGALLIALVGVTVAVATQLPWVESSTSVPVTVDGPVRPLPAGVHGPVDCYENPPGTTVSCRGYETLRAVDLHRRYTWGSAPGGWELVGDCQCYALTGPQLTVLAIWTAVAGVLWAAAWLVCVEFSRWRTAAAAFVVVMVAALAVVMLVNVTSISQAAEFGSFRTATGSSCRPWRRWGSARSACGRVAATPALNAMPAARR